MNIGIIGLGNVGKQVAHRLLDVPGTHLYLSSQHMESALWVQREKPLDLGRITIIEYNNLAKLHDTDLLIYTFDANKVKSPRREDLLPRNIEAMAYIAGFLGGYKGIQIVTTNPTDEMSYVVASLTGSDLRGIVGLNQLDCNRAVGVLDMLTSTARVKGSQFAKDIFEAYTIGPHSPQVVPYLRSINGFDPDEFRFYTDSFMNIWKKDIGEYGPVQMGLGKSTAPSTADAVKDVVEAIINEGKVVCCSTYMTLEDRLGVFIGFPLQFKDKKAIPRTGLIEFDDFIRNDFLNGYATVERNVKKLISQGSIREITENRKFPVPSLNKGKDFGNERLFVAAGDKIFSFNLNRPNNQEVVYESEKDIACLAYSCELDSFLIGSKCGVTALDSKGTARFFSHQDMSTIRSVAVLKSKDKTYIAGGSTITGLAIWDFNTGKVVDKPVNYGVCGLTPIGEELYFIGNSIECFSFNHGIKNIYRGKVSALSSSGDNLFVASGSMLGILDIKDRSLSEIDVGDRLLMGIKSIVPYFHGSIEDMFLASDGFHNVIRISLKDNQVMQTYKKQNGNLNGISRLLFKHYLFAGDYHHNNEPQVTIWHPGSSNEPYEILGGFTDRSIRGLVYK